MIYCTRRACPLLTDEQERVPVKRCTAHECPYRTRSNGDRLRSMTDEELARFIADELIEPGYYDGDQGYQLWFSFLKEEDYEWQRE